MNYYQKNNLGSKDKNLELVNVSKKYNDNLVLDDINIELYEGELVCIIGPSGCGKSTIFNIIANLTGINSGSLSVKSEISYMHQKDLLLPYKTIIDNVSLPLTIKGKDRKSSHKVANEYFPIFGLDGFQDKYPRELSGGMRQRANFLRTFLCSNELMLLDEPFGSLDSITKSDLQDWFLEVRKEITTNILMITHDIDEAIKLSDRIYVLSNKPAKVKKEIFLDKNNFDKKSIQACALVKEDILKNLK